MFYRRSRHQYGILPILGRNHRSRHQGHTDECPRNHPKRKFLHHNMFYHRSRHQYGIPPILGCNHRGDRQARTD